MLRAAGLYLPREWLEEAGVPLDPAAALRAAGLGAVCARVAGLAHAHFAGARAAMQLCDKRAMRPARLMGDTYAALLARIERQGWSGQLTRVSLPVWQKAWIALSHAFG